MKPAPFFLFLVKLLPIIVAMMVTLALFLSAGSVRAASSLYGLPLPIPDDQAHITDGIMVWGIIIVAIIFAGTLLSSRPARKRPDRPPKKK
jgi:hypothetical protein